jgi:anti-sigma regulatory factor (Ser/Thr protein kinase)
VRAADILLAGEARSAGAARRFLNDTLNRWEAARYSDSAVVVLSELVTNAALHARTEIAVRVVLDRSGLRLEVADGSPRPPIARHYSDQATTGRGLALVAALSQEWGVQLGDTGKVVWAVLAVDSRPRPGDLDPDADIDLDAFPDLDSPGPPSPQAPTSLGASAHRARIAA